MPTRFKYVQSKPSAFGLTPTEILLATDKELDMIAGLRHIAPYRKQGLGMQGRGISKRIYELKQKLKTRKWGEEPMDDGDENARSRDEGWGGKRKAGDGDGEGQGQAKKKRLGKKQRHRERKAGGQEGQDAPISESTGAVNGNRYEQPADSTTESTIAATATATAPEVEGEGKEGKTRRRKKKGGQKQENKDLQIFD